MATSTAVRPLPLNTIVKVSGVSFRQDAVRKVVEYDQVLVHHDRQNPHDANACAVVTLDGEHLGFVPKELTRRLAGVTPGGVWRAQVDEVLRNETWGLRVRIGALVSVGQPDVGAQAPGLRHRGDGLIEAANGVLAVAPVDSPADEDAATEPAVELRNVYAKSGRLLGQYVNVDGSRIHVLTPAGLPATYPAAIVTVRALDT